MKCEYCGSNIGIEEKFCTGCGRENKYYKAHRADMEEYERRFEEAEEEVTKKVGLFGKKAVFITIVAVLVALILAEVLVVINMRDINYALERRRNTRNADKIAGELRRYENEGDYIGLYNYSVKYSNVKWSALSEFDCVADAASGYYYAIMKISALAAGEMNYETAYDTASRINSNLGTMYRILKDAPDKADDKRYGKEHMDAVSDMVNEIHAYISTYCDIPMDVVATFPEMTESERFAILNEHIEKVIEDEED